MSHQPTRSRRSMLGLLGAAPVAASGLLAVPGTAQAEAGDPTLAARIQQIINRPEFAGSRWGMRFHVHDTGEPVYALNPEQRFVAASAVKVFIAGAAFSALGPRHRFRTRVYRTGPVVHGVLRGHLILVAGGDLLLGPRVRPDGSIALPEPDHSYGNGTEPIPGDPLQQLRVLAGQIARRGIRHIEGRVLVDASLFRQGQEEIANGFIPIPVSPMMLNDNIVDVVVTPGGQAGLPATLRVSPQIGYVAVVNDVATIPAGQPARPLTFTTVSTNPDGSHTVRLTGDVVLGGQPVLRPYYVPDPVRFAEIAFGRALRDEGIGVAANELSTKNRVILAEHVSPPLSEQVKPMLKLSSNVHTVYFPYLVGAIAGRDPDNAEATGDRFRRALIERAGLDPDDPANGGYSPNFFVRFLGHMARQRYFPDYRRAMPIMGRDGTLAGIAPDSPAAGHVYAKTGSGVSNTQVHSALAGYIVLPDGTLVSFAEFMTRTVGSRDEAHRMLERAGAAHGDILTAVYESLAS